MKPSFFLSEGHWYDDILDILIEIFKAALFAVMAVSLLALYILIGLSLAKYVFGR